MQGDADQGLDWLQSDPDEPKSGANKNKASDSTEDAMNWLTGASEGGDTMASPLGAADVLESATSLDWLEDEVFQASGGTAEDIASTTAILDPAAEAQLAEVGDAEIDGNNSMFTVALDDFFKGISLDESDAMEASLSSDQRIRENRIDRIVNALLKPLTRKDPVSKSQLDSIFLGTISKLVDAVHAEVVAVFFYDGEEIFLAHVFYSKDLYKKDRDKLRLFQEHVADLRDFKIPASKGIIGKALKENTAITSLNVHNDADYVEIIGRDVDFEVQTMLTAPISDGDDIYGAIQLMNKAESSGQDFFSMVDAKTLEEIAKYTARIIKRVRDPSIVPDDAELATYIARLSKCQIYEINPEEPKFDLELWETVGKEHIIKHKVLPIKLIKGKRLSVVMANPLDFQTRGAFEAISGYTIDETFVGYRGLISEVLEGQDDRPVKTDQDEKMKQILDQFEEDNASAEIEEVDLGNAEEDSAPIIKLVNQIIKQAYDEGAADIHIEPFEHKMRVRFRIDGKCKVVQDLPLKAADYISSRIKIMCGLDISERRLPQDGKIVFKKWNREGLDVDLRVATGRMAFGEKICMRLLRKGSISLGLDAMGFSPENMKLYRWATSQPYGMVLNVGPTGSGKTTTLYSALTEVSVPEINVHTAEDPIEYPLHGINQMQMQKEIGLTFARALKCFLRMDPDVILVGEIRDLETGEIAIEAALTGHLLFSTLHTNDAAGTVVRFIEMGIEPFMVSSSILLVCAQRLGRRLCKSCKEKAEEITDDEMAILKADPREITDMYRRAAKGCKKCSGNGTRGRIGIHEVLTLNEEIRELVNRSASADEIKDAARRNGMQTMYQDALWKVKTGFCDLEDILGGIKADDDIAR